MISFELVTPHGLAFQKDVYEVILPTAEGEIAVLPHHMPLITIITPGVIGLRQRADTPFEAIEHFATAGGLVEIDGRRVRVLADTAERAEDVDELAAKEALVRAKQLQRAAKDQVTVADATRLIESNLARLKVAELKRRHRHPQ